MIQELSNLVGILLEAALAVMVVGLISFIVMLLFFTPIFFVGAFFSEEPYWRAVRTGYANLWDAWRGYF